MKRIYLDYNSTSPVRTEVMDEMLPLFSDEFGNPSSSHYFGQKARSVLDKARERTAGALGCQPHEIIFTSGGTESNNLAIFGYLEANTTQAGPHIITTSIEHKSVLDIFNHLESLGVEITRVKVDGNGIINMDSFRNSFKENTILVSVMTANNEIGTIQPIAEIAEIAHEKGVAVHTDAVQAFGKIPMNTEFMKVDMLSLSGHKVYGQKGAGALFVKRGVRLKGRLLGGGQEKNLRSGTENIPAIAGFGRACELAASETDKYYNKVKRMRDILQNRILMDIENVTLNGDMDKRIPNTLSLSFMGIEAESLVTRLDMAGIAVSTGAACSSGGAEVSHVLKAIGATPETAYGAVRFSLGIYTTEEEIVETSKILSTLVRQMRNPL